MTDASATRAPRRVPGPIVMSGASRVGVQLGADLAQARSLASPTPRLRQSIAEAVAAVTPIASTAAVMPQMSPRLSPWQSPRAAQYHFSSATGFSASSPRRAFVS